MAGLSCAIPKIDAVRHAHYRPAQVEGVPVAARGHERFTFRMRRGASP